MLGVNYAVFILFAFCLSGFFLKTLFLNLLQLEKYKNYDFGRCPRVYCCGQPCLPVGQSDIPRSSTVKIYCPKCEDIYYPRSKYQGSILLLHLLLLSWIFYLHKSPSFATSFTALNVGMPLFLPLVLK